MKDLFSILDIISLIMMILCILYHARVLLKSTEDFPRLYHSIWLIGLMIFMMVSI